MKSTARFGNTCFVLFPCTRSGQHLVVMVVTGEHDSPTFQQQGDQYSAALAAAGLTVLRTVEKAEDHFRSVKTQSYEILFKKKALKETCIIENIVLINHL